MATLLVGAATGVLKSLVDKLADALSDEYKRFKGVRGDIESLILELDAMHAFLLKSSEDENPEEQDKIWTKEVRDLSYDMEDSLDEFMIRVDGKSADPRGFMDKCKNFISKLKTRQKVAKEIEKLKIQVKEAGERNKRYKNDPTPIINTSNKGMDPRALTIFEDASRLVGIDRPKAELIKLLTSHDEHAPSQKTKVVSIFGSGGLGKTTLATQVYQDLKGQFGCQAFLSMSRTPDMTKILRTILSEVSNQPYRNTEAGDIEQLIWKIRENLQDKRYLIVIDDIWKEETWKTINSALFKNSKHSIIITTTRMHHVASACCSSDGDIVHEMKSLNLADSKKLFVERLFGPEGNCPAHLVDVCNKILGKCDGVPLAIISISGLLATKPKSKCEWNRVLNSIGHGLGRSPHAQSMMQILSLSYFDLPHHLKTCLLYLSIFPEDFVIAKWRLVRRWLAEGFIEEEQDNNPYELGERCFKELINRSLIQAREINIHGEVTACQVHDTILDFIVLRSEEENFVTVFGDGYQMHIPPSKVRRLSLHASSKEKACVLKKITRARSVTLFVYSMELPLWSKFGFLRVLDLQGCIEVKCHHMADIGNLFQLKYLSFRETGVCHLPEQIGKLQCLETLELKKSNVTTLPASIAQLQRLVYMAIDEGVKLPDEAGSMTALEDLGCVGISRQSIGFIQNLGQLEHLRKVSFFLSSANSSNATEFDVADILVLGRLPALIFLQVLSDEWFEPRSLTIRGSDGFDSLRQFDFRCSCSVPVKFEVGAMPALEKLTLLFRFTSLEIGLVASDGDFPFGIQYLSSLESVYSVVSYDSVSIQDWIREKIDKMINNIVYMSDQMFEEISKYSCSHKDIGDMIFTLAVATYSLLQAKLTRDPSAGATCASDRALHRHSKFPKFKLTHKAGWWIHDHIDEGFPADGSLLFIQNTISKVLECEQPLVLGIKDKKLFNAIIKTWVDDTSYRVSLRLIQDMAYTAATDILGASSCSIAWSRDKSRECRLRAFLERMMRIEEGGKNIGIEYSVKTEDC